MFFIAGASTLAWYLMVRTWWRAGWQLARLERMKPRFLQAASGGTGEVPSRRERPGALGVTGFGGSRERFAVEVEATRLEHAVWVVGALASILPLLGLLGTVLGMLMSFEIIQAHGTGQPRLLARGIGQALLTTQAGLWTAVPVLFFWHITRNRVRLIRNEIDVLSHVAEAAKHGGSVRAGDQESPRERRLPENAMQRGA